MCFHVCVVQDFGTGCGKLLREILFSVEKLQGALTMPRDRHEAVSCRSSLGAPSQHRKSEAAALRCLALASLGSQRLAEAAAASALGPRPSASGEVTRRGAGEASIMP